MAILEEGLTAKVVDRSGNRKGNRLRSFPVVDASYEVGYVGFDGTVTLLSGPWTDKTNGRWWVVLVETDPDDKQETPYRDDTGKKGWMAEITPGAKVDPTTGTKPVNLESI